MDRIKLKKKVIEIRRRGKTYSEIQRALRISIPKSTLSDWCEKVPLPSFYRRKIKKLTEKHLEKIRPLAVLANKRKQEELLNVLRKKNEYLIRYLNKDVCKLLLSILYLGEGAKHRSTRYLKLGSSNSGIIQLYLNLLKRCFPISERKIRVTIGCRADQDIRELEKYWQIITRVPHSQFYKTQIDKRTIGKKTRRKDYKGVCRITYFDTRIQLEIEQLAKQIMRWIKKD